MTYGFSCEECGFFGVARDDEPIIRLPFYNPHRQKCPECGHEMKGELIDTDPPCVGD